MSANERFFQCCNFPAYEAQIDARVVYNAEVKDGVFVIEEASRDVEDSGEDFDFACRNCGTSFGFVPWKMD